MRITFITSQVSSTATAHNAPSIGQTIMKKMESSQFFSYSFTRNDGVIFIEGKKTLKIEGDSVIVDTDLLFQVIFLFFIIKLFG